MAHYRHGLLLERVPPDGAAPAWSPDRWLGPLVALAAAVAVGYKPVVSLWSSGVPWVLNVYQNVSLGLSDLALALVALTGWLTLRWEPERRRPAGTRVVGVAGGVLLACLALSALVARAPLLSFARGAEVAAGLLACLAVARRPGLARWLLLGCGLLLVVELPLVVLQEATQSTFPTGTTLDGWRREVPATASGAAVILGPHGLRWQRALGSFPHPNVLGGFTALILVLGLPWLARGGRSHLALLAGWTIAWGELVFSFSRAALLAAALGCGLWLLGQPGIRARGRRLLVLAGPPLAALALGLVLAGPALLPRLTPDTATANGPAVGDRLLLIEVAVRLIRAHPLLGVGAGNFPLAELAPPFNAVSVEPVHVVPLLVAAEAGIPAGLAWLAVVLGQPVAEWRRQRRREVTFASRLALPVALLTLASLDHYFWTFAPGRALFWITLGIWAAWPERDAPTRGDERAGSHAGSPLPAGTGATPGTRALSPAPGRAARRRDGSRESRRCMRY